MLAYGSFKTWIKQYQYVCACLTLSSTTLLDFFNEEANILLLLLSSDIVDMFHTDIRFRYRGKILLEVRKHKLLGHIYKQRTYARAHKLIPVSALLMI